MRLNPVVFRAVLALSLVTALALTLVGCGGGGGGDPIPAGEGLTGTWDTYYYNETTSKDWLTMRQVGSTLEGQWNSEYPIEGTIDGTSVKIEVQAPAPTHFSIKAQMGSNNASLSGTWIVSGAGRMDGSHPWRAVKRP